MQELLEQHLRTGGAELVCDEHVVDRGLGVRSGLGDDDALAGGETVRLDDDRQSVVRKRGLGGHGIGKGLGLAGRNARGVHDLLGEALRALQPRTGGNGAERDDAFRRERVHEPRYERRLGADHDEVRTLRLRPGDDSGNVLRLEVDVRRHGARAGVARCAEELVALRILGEPPRDGVLAPARSDYEYLHITLSSAASASGRREGCRS